MSDPDKNIQDVDDLSTDQILAQIEEDKKQVKKSSIFAFAALVAIIALCIAWFVMNTVVKGTSSSVSADDNNPFMLASVGSRINAEQSYLKDENNNNLLTAGTVKKYNSYIDVKTGKEEETGEKEYHTGTSSLAWYLNGQNSFAPGSSGKLEFYLIPKIGGLNSAKISLNTTGYTISANGRRAEKVENEKIQSLIDGHILLFQNLDDTYGYTGWLGETPDLTVKAPNGTFEKNVPYKVTIYWVWPRYFRNYIYTQRSTQEDLFTDNINQGEGSEYQELIKFINEQKSLEKAGKLFYSDNQDDTSIDSGTKIDNQMSDGVLDKCSQYYNQADEYIGKNTKYVYVEMKVD